MSELVLKSKEEQRILGGHLWVFSNEVSRVDAEVENGSVMDVVASKGQFLGQAYYNRHTLIAARLLSRRREAIDAAFFAARLGRAKAWRESLGLTGSCRVVYSEGDLLPGLVVDRYENYLVVQSLTLGMEKLRAPLMAALSEVLAPSGILLRNDSPFRALENLPSETVAVQGDVPERVTIEEAGARFLVDLRGGQKTGFYFDQRETRALARSLARNRRVLDCFSYTGGFAVNCALGGAVSVLAIDNSAAALQILQENARLNDVAGLVTARRGNCFDELREMEQRKERFDLIILDPPAFVKSKSHLKAGLIGYREINATAMKLLAPDGILLTCSCSQNLSGEEFQNVLRQASRGARKHFRLVRTLTQSSDHPILQAMPETQYLKCAVLQAL